MRPGPGSAERSRSGRPVGERAQPRRARRVASGVPWVLCCSPGLSRALRVGGQESKPGRAWTRLSGDGAPGGALGGAPAEPGTAGQAVPPAPRGGLGRACLGRGEEAPSGSHVLGAHGTPAEPADHLHAEGTLVAGAHRPVFPGMEMCQHAPQDSVRGEESPQATSPGHRKPRVQAWRVVCGVWRVGAARSQAPVGIHWSSTREELRTPCSSQLEFVTLWGSLHFQQTGRHPNMS